MNNVLLHLFIFAVHIPVYPAKILTECTLFLISWLVQKNMIFSKKGNCLVPIHIKKKSGECI